MKLNSTILLIGALAFAPFIFPSHSLALGECISSSSFVNSTLTAPEDAIGPYPKYDYVDEITVNEQYYGTLYSYRACHFEPDYECDIAGGFSFNPADCSCTPPDPDPCEHGEDEFGNCNPPPPDPCPDGSQPDALGNCPDPDPDPDPDCPGGDCPDPDPVCPDGYVGNYPFCFPTDPPDPDPDNPDPDPDPDNPDPNENPDLNGGHCPAGYTGGYVGGHYTCVANSNVNDGQCSGAGQVYGEVNGVWGCHNINFNIDDNNQPINENSQNLNNSASDLKAAAIALKDSANKLNAVDGSIKQNGQKLDDINQGVGELGQKLDEGNAKLDGITEGIGESNDKLGDISDKLGDPSHECDPTAANYFDCLNPNGVNQTTGYEGSQGNAQGGFAALYSDFSTAPIVMSLQPTNFFVVPDGSCPTLEFDLPELGHVGTDLHCEIYSTISPYLTVLAHFLYFWAAYRVFASS